jgi:hypothetical protein
VILTYVQEPRICNVRLTNGLRRIFDPLAPLAGLALSASALGLEVEVKPKSQ